MRPGRLDRILYVGPPDLEGRTEILRIRTEKMAVEPGLDLAKIAVMVNYFQGCISISFNSNCVPFVDRWMLGCRNRRFMPRSSDADHETRYSCTLCMFALRRS